MPATAIVLKLLNSPYKIALLDTDKGRIDAIVRHTLCVGSLIEYTVDSEKGDYCFISNVSLLDMPFAVARQDLLFWHHVLELCFYFTPIGSHTGQLFELLYFLYTVDITSQWDDKSKKMYLFKLLAAIGLYDALPHLVPIGRVAELLALPLEKIVHESLDEKSKRVVHTWLRTCIAEHPYMQQFNTVHFLGDMDNYE